MRGPLFAVRTFLILRECCGAVFSSTSGQSAEVSRVVSSRR